MGEAQSESLSTPCQTPEEAYSGPVHLQHSIIQTDIALAAYTCERERADAGVSILGQVMDSLQALLEKAE